MYYIANYSVVSLESVPEITDSFQETNELESIVKEFDTYKVPVFCQADLWNLQKHARTIHVTDRLPRTWEGLW